MCYHGYRTGSDNSTEGHRLIDAYVPRYVEVVVAVFGSELRGCPVAAAEDLL